MIGQMANMQLVSSLFHLGKYISTLSVDAWISRYDPLFSIFCKNKVFKTSENPARRLILILILIPSLQRTFHLEFELSA